MHAATAAPYPRSLSGRLRSNPMPRSPTFSRVSRYATSSAGASPNAIPYTCHVRFSHGLELAEAFRATACVDSFVIDLTTVIEPTNEISELTAERPRPTASTAATSNAISRRVQRVPSFQPWPLAAFASLACSVTCVILEAAAEKPGHAPPTGQVCTGAPSRPSRA